MAERAVLSCIGVLAELDGKSAVQLWWVLSLLGQAGLYCTCTVLQYHLYYIFGAIGVWCVWSGKRALLAGYMWPVRE